MSDPRVLSVCTEGDVLQGAIRVHREVNSIGRSITWIHMGVAVTVAFGDSVPKMIVVHYEKKWQLERSARIGLMKAKEKGRAILWKMGKVLVKIREDYSVEKIMCAYRKARLQQAVGS